MKGYYKISEMRTAKGLFELWESKKYGDEVAAKVTLCGIEIGETWNDLRTFINDEME
jgi:hypothetical protein